MYNYELYHHGIKGMKWGVRRFQNTDGSLTSAGRKRYSDDPALKKAKQDYDSYKKEFKKAKKSYNKAYNKYALVPKKDNFDNFKEARNTYLEVKTKNDRNKLNYKTEKEAVRLRKSGKTFDNKSKHRLKLEAKYKELGMTDEQAQAAANNRIRTEKIIAASAAITVAACVAYAANKQIRAKTDGLIKAGSTLQRIEMQNTNGKLHDMFYASQGDHDNKRYAGLLGAVRKQQTGEAYIMKLKATKDIKVASQDKAAKIFKNLYDNDESFKSSVNKWVPGADKLKPKLAYEKFNQELVTFNMLDKGTGNKFYSALKSAGYGAIQDVNDMKYSGYSAKNPLIIFDHKDSIMVESFSEMTGDLMRNGNIELGKATAETIFKNPAVWTQPAVGLTAAAVVTRASDPTKKYKKKSTSKK